MTRASTRLVALVGHPIAHSRSPSMMTSLFGMLGMDATYVAFDVTSASLARAVDGLHALGALGANVTLPHKIAVGSLCVELDPAATAIGAVNTLVRRESGWLGCNTDGEGAMRAFEDAGVAIAGARVVVLGTGGAAQAVSVAAALRGASAIAMVGRDLSKTVAWAKHLSGLVSSCESRAVAWGHAAREAIGSAKVIIHATPMGMHGHPVAIGSDELAWLNDAREGTAAMDLVYNPRETAWLRAARTRGLVAIDGVGMLAHQATLSVEHWFGTKVASGFLRRFLDGELPSG